MFLLPVAAAISIAYIMTPSNVNILTESDRIGPPDRNEPFGIPTGGSNIPDKQEHKQKGSIIGKVGGLPLDQPASIAPLYVRRDRDGFLKREAHATHNADPDRPYIKARKHMYRIPREVERPFEPTIEHNRLTGGNHHSVDRIRRSIHTKQKDFVDSNGKMIDSFSTGQIDSGRIWRQEHNILSRVNESRRAHSRALLPKTNRFNEVEGKVLNVQPQYAVNTAPRKSTSGLDVYRRKPLITRVKTPVANGPFNNPDTRPQVASTRTLKNRVRKGRAPNVSSAWSSDHSRPSEIVLKSQRGFEVIPARTPNKIGRSSRAVGGYRGHDKTTERSQNKTESTLDSSKPNASVSSNRAARASYRPKDRALTVPRFIDNIRNEFPRSMYQERQYTFSENSRKSDKRVVPFNRNIITDQTNWENINLQEGVANRGIDNAHERTVSEYV